MPTGVAAYVGALIDGDGRFRFATPSLTLHRHFPYGLVRYHNMVPDAQPSPLGTVMYAKAFFHPIPKSLPSRSCRWTTGTKRYGYAGTKVAPAENHILSYLRTSQAATPRIGLET